MRAFLFLLALAVLPMGATATASDAVVPGVDVFAAVGGVDAPNTNDFDGYFALSLGAGYRSSDLFALGLEGYLQEYDPTGSESSSAIILTSVYGKFYPFSVPVIHPYGRLGLGFLNIRTGDNLHSGALIELIPQWALGLEAGWKHVAFYAELTARYNMTIDDEQHGVPGFFLGLSGHIPLAGE
jgi:hypothetical protein